MTIAGFPRGVPLPTWPGMPNRTLDQEAAAPNVSSTVGQVLAETYDRRSASTVATGATLTSGDLLIQAIALRQGQVIGHLGWLAGSTGSATITHQWMSLLDQNLYTLAATADQLAANITASTGYNFAIATAVPAGSDFAPSGIALVTATSYVAPYTGLYYIGLLTTGTVPTTSGVTTTAAIQGLTPKLGGISTTGLTVPPTTSAQQTSPTSGTHNPYFVAAA